MTAGAVVGAPFQLVRGHPERGTPAPSLELAAQEQPESLV